MAPDTFREFHRARRRSAALRGAGIALVAAVAGSGLTLWGVAAASPPASDSARAQSAVVVAELDLQLPTLVEPAAPQPAALVSQADPAPSAPGIELPTTGPTAWSIAIATTGYQPEIDQCLWVRMDLGAAAPIVGAHNYCGGGIVLEMQLGQTVDLVGTGLDGSYVVTESRDARGGDPAAAATSGMTVDVILQTCYWIDDGSVRLVGLQRLG